MRLMLLRHAKSEKGDPGMQDRDRTLNRRGCEDAPRIGAYLAHQDVEERQIMAPLEAAIGVPAVGALHGAIIASIPPDEMAAALPIMLAAMNIDNRGEVLGGMRATAPAPVFEGVYGLAASVLEPADFAALGARLGITPAG